MVDQNSENRSNSKKDNKPTQDIHERPLSHIDSAFRDYQISDDEINKMKWKRIKNRI